VRLTGGVREALQHFSIDGRHFRMEAAFLEAEFVGESQGLGEHELRWATSNKIYQAIGHRPVCDAAEYPFGVR